MSAPCALYGCTDLHNVLDWLWVSALRKTLSMPHNASGRASSLVHHNPKCLPPLILGVGPATALIPGLGQVLPRAITLVERGLVDVESLVSI